MYYGNFAVHRLGACASLLGMSLREVHETLFLLRAAACSLVPHGFVLAGRVGLSGVAAATLDRAFGNIDGFEFDFARVGSKLRLALSGKSSTRLHRPISRQRAQPAGQFHCMLRVTHVVQDR